MKINLINEESEYLNYKSADIIYDENLKPPDLKLCRMH